MADLLSLSSRIIDSGTADEPVNRITNELSELAEDLSIVESFSHVVTLRTDDGLVCFDTSGPASGRKVVDAIRGWSDARFHSLVYTHGHIDHVGGCGAFVADAANHGQTPALVVGHENVAARFERYRQTDGYNQLINARQFLGLADRGLDLGAGMKVEVDSNRTFLPAASPEPAVTYRESMALNVGGEQIQLRHARGETDDHTWAWLPKQRTICAGDFFIWNFPNAGNPQKVQRYPLEWARALRDMAAMDAELFVPAHGLPIGGADRIRAVLLEVAETLEDLVTQTIDLMNAGARLNDIVHSVRVADEILSRPYLKPLYDEPEFLVRNVWRMYGGWYDGNPAHLKPARESELATELAALAGGSAALAARAQVLSDAGDHRLACHLIEFAVQAAPADREVHAIRVDIYTRRRSAESSLMAKGIFGYTANESRQQLD